jgi:hypothetical protein
LVQKWHAALASGEPLEAEARVRRADGEYRLLLHFVSRDEDHWDFVMTSHQLTLKLNAAHPGHPHVQNQARRFLGGKGRASFPEAAGILSPSDRPHSKIRVCSMPSAKQLNATGLHASSVRGRQTYADATNRSGCARRDVALLLVELAG